MSDRDRYRIPVRIHRVEETIQRSRFITAVAHAPDAQAAHAFVERIRDELPDATHHCWAFVAGPPGSTTRMGMSDAGEPHGTAGRPMLTSLLHGGVGEIVAVCARYYGGVKLGTGGLGRAYAGGVKLALEGLPTEDRLDRILVRVTIGYAEVDALQRLAEEMEVLVEGENYGAQVRYDCAVPVSVLEDFRLRVAEMTRGAGAVEEDA